MIEGKEFTMARYLQHKAGFVMVLSCFGALVLGGCRRTEMVTIASADSTVDMQVESVEGQSGSSSPAANTSGIAIVPVSSPAVQPVPYHRPVVTPAVFSQVVSTRYEPAGTRSTLVTVPAGTVLRVELKDYLSSHTSQVGQRFYGSIDQDVAADGQVAIERGSVVVGRVSEAEPAKKIGGRARLSLEFENLELPSGQRRAIEAQFAERGKSSTAKDAAIIGGSTIGGAVIGEAIEDGEGGVIGAIVGGLGGAYAAKKTKAKPVEVPAGTILNLELTEPLTLEIFPRS